MYTTYTLLHAFAKKKENAQVNLTVLVTMCNASC